MCIAAYIMYIRDYIGKPTIYAQELKSIFCLYMIDTPRNTKHKQ